MATDQRLHKITLDTGVVMYINSDDVRDFYTKEGQTFLETISGVVYKIMGAPNIDDFYNNTFIVQPSEIRIVNSPLPISGDVGTINKGISMTVNQIVTNITNNSMTIFNANVNRKKLYFKNISDNLKEPIFIHFGTPATITNGIPLVSDESYEPPDGAIYLGVITVISGSTSVKPLYAEEWI